MHDPETGGAKEFIIARNGRPAARLVPLHVDNAGRGRLTGVAKGRSSVPDNIDEPGEELADLFQGR